MKTTMRKMAMMLIGLCAMGIGITSMAQEVKHPMSALMEKGKYDAAAEKLVKQQKAAPTNIELLVSEALLYSEANYPKHNDERAFLAAHKAACQMGRADQKALEKLARQGITPELLLDIMEHTSYALTKKIYAKSETKTLRNAKDFLRKMTYAPEDVRAQAQAISDSLEAVFSKREEMANEKAMALFEEAKAKGEIKEMERLFAANAFLNKSDECVLAIHSVYADLGSPHAFRLFYSSKNGYAKRSIITKPYYEDGSSIAQRDKEIEECVGEHIISSMPYIISSKYYIKDPDRLIRLSAPSLIAIHALENLIKPYIDNKQLKEALLLAKSYAQYFGNDRRYANVLKALDRGIDPKIKAEIIDLDIDIEGNSQYTPALTMDGKKLYVCASNNNTYEQIFSTEIGTNGKYKRKAEAEPVRYDYFMASQYANGPCAGDPLEGNTAALTFSSTGNDMIFFWNGQLCVASHTHQGWKPVNFLAISEDEHWQSDIQIASSGNAMLLASSRLTDRDPGDWEDQMEKSNTNIYVTVRDENGKWSDLIDLGPTINTMGCERSPFLHPDMKTLYFCSDGHGGLGDLDTYVSHRLSDTCWTCWSEPENLGPNYNTTGKDWGFQISTDGKSIYYATEIDKQAQTQANEIQRCFRINIEKGLKPGCVVMLTGKALDKEGKPVVGDIVWDDLDSDTEAGRATINPENGSFFVVLPGGKIYSYYIDGNDIVPVATTIDLTDLKETKSETTQMNVLNFYDVLKNGEVVPMNNISFESGDTTLHMRSRAELRRMAKLIRRAGIHVEIAGHTDNSGNDATNMKLSEGRARAVKRYLIRRGISADLLEAVGYGASQPIESNDTEEGRQKNRRVELHFKP